MLGDATTILDVGTGDGHLARHLTQVSDAKFLGLDVCPQPKTFIDVCHYDGHTFPFENNTFDCVLMVDMLHHADNIPRLVSEASRVAKHFILIKDHFWKTRLDWLTLKFADYIGNIPYNVPLPYNYLRLEEWRELFEQHALETVSHDTFKYIRMEPAHHILVKLATA